MRFQRYDVQWNECVVFVFRVFFFDVTGPPLSGLTMYTHGLRSPPHRGGAGWRAGARAASVAAALLLGVHPAAAAQSFPLPRFEIGADAGAALTSSWFRAGDAERAP